MAQDFLPIAARDALRMNQDDRDGNHVQPDRLRDRQAVIAVSDLQYFSGARNGDVNTSCLSKGTFLELMAWFQTFRNFQILDKSIKNDITIAHILFVAAIIP